ncbi:hypothetical protein PB01_08560 [Psychrobacillus glaciei]|uniref:Uncharacterized protein n=1 Tax=Psychrobacillus glaciei TaxID=2283160 RepID=A0A5J6SLK5_9BACI|nr:hypothetical protein [Psychrobacillus glaciei]QFF98880.1 hypothetical protein PB01_08560 [Psychrobacillus glaciei]
MRIISYACFNLIFIYICVLAFYKGFQEGISIIFLSLATIITILLINLMIYIFDKISSKLFDLIIKMYNKRKMKNFNLFEWIGETKWLKLYDTLKDIKEFDNNSIHDNFKKIKKEINKEFNSKEKLKSFKLYLEVIVESPKLIILNTVIQTLLLAVITTSLINYINEIKNMN